MSRIIRDKLGISQDDLASYLLVLRSYVQDYERRKGNLSSKAQTALNVLESRLTEKEKTDPGFKPDLSAGVEMVRKFLSEKLSDSRRKLQLLERKRIRASHSHDQHMEALANLEWIFQNPGELDEHQLLNVTLWHRLEREREEIVGYSPMAMLEIKIELMQKEIEVLEGRLGQLDS